MKYDFNGKYPRIGNSVFIAENSAVIGDVTLGDNASVWFSATVRADDKHIEIGEASNIQDSATIHAGANVGCRVTIGHNAIVHGCEICDDVLIGMGAIILDDAKIGEFSIVGAGALVTKGKVFPPRSLIIGSPAVLKRELTDDEIASIRESSEEYTALARKYMK